MKKRKKIDLEVLAVLIKSIKEETNLMETHTMKFDDFSEEENEEEKEEKE